MAQSVDALTKKLATLNVINAALQKENEQLKARREQQPGRGRGAGRSPLLLPLLPLLLLLLPLLLLPPLLLLLLTLLPAAAAPAASCLLPLLLPLLTCLLSL